MIAAAREERTGRALMNPTDFALITTKISHDYGVSVYDASIALDQAIAFVMTVAALDGPGKPKFWPSIPVDNAWRVWLAHQPQYGHVAGIAGAHVDRYAMVDPARPDSVIRSAEAVAGQGWVLHREAWYDQGGARSIGFVTSRLMTPAQSAPGTVGPH
ncbi:hypothetical protein [Amycolatopsis sp. NPDC021455]|uniref:hypothetical protein n=1 Tax=Amycolatopsis sp. NPDC021455 TaxID=3154901 RepID=UPI0033D3717B